FPTIDRFSEKYSSMSPYQYTAGNPVKYVDINGDSVWVFSRALDMPGGGAAVHTFIVAKPDENNPDGTTYYISFYESDDGNLVGTEKEAKTTKNKDGVEERSVETVWGDSNWNTDVNWSESKLKGKELIVTPEGKTDTEFISDIRKNAKDQNNAGFKYKAVTTERNCSEAGNCNSSTTTILYNSGVSLNRIKKIDPPGYNPGIGIINKRKN
ncbi:MAG: hypothetical protein KIT62_17925, partial [Cyclobacteriaceae bacterium]|nr:hypothetical protein [Cyclobacteriaceae bacterium]